MPSTVIEVRTEHPDLVEEGLIEAVHSALVTAFRIPEEDKHVRLVVHEPRRFAVPPTLAEPEKYTVVTVDCFAGRSVDAKRRLYAEVVGRIAEFGIPRDHVTVIVRDLPTESWGRPGAGRRPATSTSDSM